MSDSLADALGRLRLPISDSSTTAAVTAAAGALSNYDPDDQGRVVLNETTRWRNTGSPSELLTKVIRAALEAGAGEDAALGALKSTYFVAHKELREQELLAFDQATAILSHASLIAHLAAKEELSASRIAGILRSLDERADVHWQAVERVLRKMKLYRTLDNTLVDETWARDQAAEPGSFGDADVRDSALIVGEIGGELGFPADLSRLLGAIVSDDLGMHGPHLRMLFFQCLIAEFSDHELTVIYEFSPRGEIAGALFKRLEDLPGAMNAFLNNAKGVDRLDEGWARSRKARERASALALVRVLSGLDSLGFSARRELAGWLRMWILRILNLIKPTLSLVPTQLSAPQIATILADVCGNQTSTLGILEQRAVDVLSTQLHPSPIPWAARGVGDAVNASNVSRRKLGDVEFMDVNGRAIVAYEAHAGHLSTVYATAHIQSLRPIIASRSVELLSIDPDPSKWHIKIIFVAHSFDALPVPEVVEGFTFELVTTTFDDLRQLAGVADSGAFIDLFVTPLNERRTPQLVRDRLNATLGASGS